MTIEDYKKLITNEMNLTGLIERGWRADISKRFHRALGKCCFGSKKIILSEYFVLANSAARVRTTILHEIAHALAGSKAKHGPEWKAVCLKIGGDAKRLADSNSFEKDPSKYPHTYVCPNCGYQVHRNSKKRYPIACGPCCNKYANKKYSDAYEMKYYPRAEAPKYQRIEKLKLPSLFD